MEPTITIAGLVGMLALVKSLTDFARRAVNFSADRAGTIHQLIAYTIAVAVVFLFGASQLGDFAVPGTDLLLSNMDGATKLIVGLAIGGSASVVTDFFHAVDASNTAKVPPIIGG